MRLVAIYNAWSDCLDLLQKSIDNIAPVVDGVIVVWSNKSNKGQFIRWNFHHEKAKFIQVEPIQGLAPHQNETMKRNFGIDSAKKDGYTHFLMMDCDEFYQQIDVMWARGFIEQNNLNGLVSPLRVYIKEPTLWCEDHTLVPFVHRLTPNVSVGSFRSYPHAYDKDGMCHIDPTRRPSFRDGIERCPVFMHHMSYVRQNIELKINNSTANLSNSKGVILRDFENAKPGYKSELYHRELKECADLFKIKGPETL